MIQKDSRIYVAGHQGLAGSALMRKFEAEGFSNLITRSHTDLDLSRQAETEAFFKDQRPECVVLAAAKVGGIVANNTYPAQFIYENLAIEINVIHAAWEAGVKRLIFLGSSCIYPRECQQPMQEHYLLTGPLEQTNEPYAVAKIAGIKMCQSYNRQYGTRFFSVMPTNLYGPNDNFNLETSHVLPALLRKIHEAKKADADTVTVWGTGTPRREFLHADDFADAVVHLMTLDDAEFDDVLTRFDIPLMNIGCGSDVTITDLAETIKQIVGFKGKIVYDRSKPDGTPRKLLDVSRLQNLGWQHRISLEDGIRRTYQWCLDNQIFD